MKRIHDFLRILREFFENSGVSFWVRLSREIFGVGVRFAADFAEYGKGLFERVFSLRGRFIFLRVLKYKKGFPNSFPAVDESQIYTSHLRRQFVILR